MKIKIVNKSYACLKHGIPSVTFCVNDFVSTTRKDTNGILHQYESRHSLLKAFMHASRSRRVTVVCDDNDNGLVVKLIGVEDVVNGGLACKVHLAPLEAAS